MYRSGQILDNIVNPYNKYTICPIIEYYGAEKLRTFIQTNQKSLQNIESMGLSQAGGCYRDPLYNYNILIQYGSIQHIWINFGKIFPEKHSQIMRLIVEIKQSPFYTEYLKFMNKYFIRQFDTVVQQHLHQNECYQNILDVVETKHPLIGQHLNQNEHYQNILDVVETKYLLIQQSYKLYKFYIAFWLNSLYGMYPQVNFDISEFLTQIIKRKLYTFDVGQSQTILRAFDKEEQITYQHNIFEFNFHKIDILFDELLTQQNERRYTNSNEYSGILEMSLVDVVLNEFETLTIIDGHEIVHPFKSHMIRMEHIFKKYDRTLYECSLCKNHYHQDELFIYKCCNKYICPHCVYERNLQQQSPIVARPCRNEDNLQYTPQQNPIFACPCCNKDIRSAKISGHVFCGNIPDFEVSALSSDDYQDDGYQNNEQQEKV